MYFSSIVIVLIVLIPDNVYAWGPAAHLELGLDILNNIRFLPPLLQRLLLEFPYDYLYGNISADIVIGKNLTETLKHCHNWRTGINALQCAETDSQKAFAFGYVSHLAADTIAHNYFIPEKFIQSFSSRVLKHTYWEIRFDALADKSVWKLSSKITKNIHDGNDELLKKILEDTPLSFRTNKTIFSSILLINRLKQWQTMLSMISSSSKWGLSKDERRRYYNLSLLAISDFLIHGVNAKCYRDDPTGKERLNTAKRFRNQLKMLKHNGKDWETAMERAMQLLNT